MPNTGWLVTLIVLNFLIVLKLEEILKGEAKWLKMLALWAGLVLAMALLLPFTSDGNPDMSGFNGFIWVVFLMMYLGFVFAK